MIDIFFFILLTAIAILLIVIPFLRREPPPPRETFNLAVHEDQLAELDRDLERGVIDVEAARAARLEIQRRILALAGETRPSANLPEGRSGLVVTALLVVVVPLASAAVYLQLGKPQMRDVPLAQRVLPSQENDQQESLLASIQRQQERVDEAPDNGALWTQLARTQLQGGLYGDAAGSFTKAIELTGDPMLRVELGETLVQGAEGLVTPGALEQFRTVLQTVPNEPRAHYYLGVAFAQEGKVDEAVDSWTHLLAISPSNAPFRTQIIGSIRSVLESNGRSADEIVAGLPAGGVAAVGGPEASDDNAHARDDQIRGMVEGLAARLEDEPDNLEGWLMLGRSRMVLDEPALAQAAFARAKELAPEDPEVLTGYAASLLEPSLIPGSDPIVGEEAAAVYETLVSLTPDDPEPRWLLGLAAAQSGEEAAAIDHWQDMLELIGDEVDDRAIVEARIAALENGDPSAALDAGTPSFSPGGGAATAGGATTASGTDPSNASAGTAPTAGGATTASGTDPSNAGAGTAPTAGGATTASGTDPSNASAGTAPARGPGPTEEDRAAMAALSPEERSGQIRSMVEGLAARLEDDPSDIEGWLRLAQSRSVLGEPEAAEEAYRRAMEQEPENTEVLRAFAGSLLGETHPETRTAAVGDEAADLYRQIIAINPDDPEAHWYLGLAAVQNGVVDDAKSHWQRVLDVLDPDHPNYAGVQASLEQVQDQTQ